MHNNSHNRMKNIFQNIIANVFSDLPRKHATWLEAIEVQDDLLALQSATRGLEAVLADDALTISVRNRIIETATHKTRPILRKVNQQFVRFEYMDSSIESNMLSTVYSFHKMLYANYLSLLDDFTINPVSYDNNAIYQLLSETINQIFEMMKWRSYVHLGLSPKVWLQLHRIFSLVNDNNLLDKKFRSNEAELESPQEKPTLAAQIVQTYMLDSLQQANLSRQGIDIVCKILQHELLHVEIAQEFNPIKFLFYADLAKDAGAKRIRHFTPTDTCIYWHIDALEKEFSTILDKHTNMPVLTAWCNLLGLEPTQMKVVPETLSALLREWSRKEYRRQRRKEDRTKLTTTANVAYGIQSVCERAKAHEDKKLLHGARVSADGRTLDERLRSHAIFRSEETKLKNDRSSNHHWVIVDESERGLGAVASSEFNNWISVGKLVGLVLADSQQSFVIAIIRSARPKANRQIQVGMEVLSRHAKWVQLEITSTPASSGAFDAAAQLTPRAFSGLYLPIEAGISTESSLLLPKIEFIANAQYQISIAGMLESLVLGKVQDSKDDWVKVVYPR